MEIAQSKTRDQFPLSSKIIIKKTISGTIGCAFILFLIFLFGGGMMISLILSSKGGFAWLGFVVIGFFILLFLVFFLTYLYQRWYFATYFYDLTPDFVQIKKGPITPREITIPYERIQDVYVDQDLLDRFFGLYDVHISSATFASGTQAHIDGVEKQAADGLREALLETVKQRIGKNRSSDNVAPNK